MILWFCLCFGKEYSSDVTDYFGQWILMYFRICVYSFLCKLPHSLMDLCQELHYRGAQFKYHCTAIAQQCAMINILTSDNEEQFMEEVCLAAIIILLLVNNTMLKHPSTFLMDKKVSIWITAHYQECFVCFYFLAYELEILVFIVSVLWSSPTLEYVPQIYTSFDMDFLVSVSESGMI